MQNKIEDEKYFLEIKNIIEKIEVSHQVRQIEENIERVQGYWEIGKQIVEAQGGEKRAKYGSALIKEWGNKLKEEYGNNYDYTNLSRMIKFYMFFPNIAAVRQHLNWTQVKSLLPIKNETERNYYINQVILNNLSSRELEKIIKNKSYDRLSYVDKENIKLIDSEDYSLTIEDMIKDPILINIDKKTNYMNEKMLHKYIIDMLEERFLELGKGFTLVGHEYKIIVDNRTYKIDLLFFNYELNSFVVVELKVRELKIGDKEQVNFYVNYVDRNLKKKYMNKTVGILIVKKNNKLVLEYTTNDDIFITTYKLLEKAK